MAETTYVTGVRRGNARSLRLIARRTRLLDSSPGRPGAGLATPRLRHQLALPLLEADQFHRDHARVELAIRDLKEGAGLEHCPSRQFLRQRSLAGLRRAVPQPHPLD